jgi:hypothetical protein
MRRVFATNFLPYSHYRTVLGSTHPSLSSFFLFNDLNNIHIRFFACFMHKNEYEPHRVVSLGSEDIPGL